MSTTLSSPTDIYRESVRLLENNLTVNQLKNILKNGSLMTSGRKAVLIQRISDHLGQSLRRNDVHELRSMYVAIMNEVGYHPSMARATVQPTYTQAANNLGTSGHGGARNGHSVGSGANRPGGRAPQSASNIKLGFLPDPFYRLGKPLHTPVLFKGPYQSDRVHLSTNFTLSTEDEQAVVSGTKRVFFLSQIYNGTAEQRPIQFPVYVEVYVNMEPVSANFRGVKGKVGSTRPADVTEHIARALSMGKKRSTISVNVTLNRDPSRGDVTDQYTYAMCAYTGTTVPTLQVLDEIKARPRISRESAVALLHAMADDDDIVAMATVHSLRDNISFSRIEVPVRSVHCQHIDCMDGETFLELQQQAPTWTCSRCDKRLRFEDLAVDAYFEEVLRQTPQEIEEVEVQPSGEWKRIDVAPSDDDSDDSDVPLQSRSKSVASSVHRQQPEPIVIDLDESSDDEEMMRLADSVPPSSGGQSQRQSQGQNQGQNQGPLPMRGSFVDRAPSQGPTPQQLQAQADERLRREEEAAAARAREDEERRRRAEAALLRRNLDEMYRGIGQSGLLERSAERQAETAAAASTLFSLSNGAMSLFDPVQRNEGANAQPVAAPALARTQSNGSAPGAIGLPSPSDARSPGPLSAPLFGGSGTNGAAALLGIGGTDSNPSSASASHRTTAEPPVPSTAHHGLQSTSTTSLGSLFGQSTLFDTPPPASQSHVDRQQQQPPSQQQYRPGKPHPLPPLPLAQAPAQTRPPPAAPPPPQPEIIDLTMSDDD